MLRKVSFAATFLSIPSNVTLTSPIGWSSNCSWAKLETLASRTISAARRHRPQTPSPESTHYPPTSLPQYRTRWSHSSLKKRAVRAKIFRSKSPPKSNLKSEIVFPARHVGQRPLFILRYERQLVRNPVLECKYLVLVLRKIRRIGDPQIPVDLPPDRQPGRRIESLARNDRVDLENVESKQASVAFRIGSLMIVSVNTSAAVLRPP